MIFKAREMIDIEMKTKIIIHFKSIVDHEDKEIKKLVKLALNCLSQNPSMNFKYFQSIIYFFI